MRNKNKAGKLSDYKVEFMVIFAVVLSFGILIGYGACKYETKLTIGDFQMNKEQFEEVTEVMDTTQPVTICEIDEEHCLVFVVVKRLSQQQIQGVQQNGTN